MNGTGSDYLLSALTAEGVSTLFGLVGEGNSYLVDRVNGAALKYRYARHEQVAESTQGRVRIASTDEAVTLGGPRRPRRHCRRRRNQYHYYPG